jgi:hypothetical protein
MKSPAKFRDYFAHGAKWITVAEGEFYPDYLDDARALYGPAVKRFEELADSAIDSADLLRRISSESPSVRSALLRLFRRYVSPATSVEMLKRKQKLEDTIRSFGERFRSLDEVRARLKERPEPDDALLALLYENRNRGEPGYELTAAFFAWFEETHGHAFGISGPVRAGRDVMLDEVLDGYQKRTPADFLIRDKSDSRPVVVGFAHYDSDRGGAQEDDRTGGNADKIASIRSYSTSSGVRLKTLFVNDGPGLLLGSMWNDYSDLEESGDDVLVATLKMLPSRVTRAWLMS